MFTNHLIGFSNADFLNQDEVYFKRLPGISMDHLREGFL